MSESDRALAVAPPDAAAYPEQQNSLGSLNQLPGTLLTRLCSLDITDAKTLALYEKIESAAVNYRKEDIKAKRYVRGAQNLASNIIMAFEGLRSGRYTQEEVFEDFAEDMEDSQQDLLTPLQEVTCALANVADDVFSLIKASGLLASEYQLAGRRFELMKDLTADISKNQAATSVLSTLPKLLGISSSGFGAAVAVFSVLSQAVSAWGAIEHRKMKENEQLLTALNNELSEVARIMNEQQLLLQMTYDVIGLESKMQSMAEKRLASGTPTTLTVDKIIKAAKDLEALCLSFLRGHTANHSVSTNEKHSTH